MALLKSSKIHKKDFLFVNKKVAIYLPKDKKTINIFPYLANPSDFRGDTEVDCVVSFGGIFEPLIGEYHDQYGPWKEKNLTGEGIIILEYFFDEAQRVIDNPKYYDDRGLCREYWFLAKAGYDLLRKNQSQVGIGKINIPVSLERAGLVTTRLALGFDKDKKIKNEIRVVTKRTHLKGEPKTHLTVTVKWRDLEKAKSINNQTVDLIDFVNPASGASGAGFLIAAMNDGVKPSIIIHRSICLTRQGTLFIKKAFARLGIKTFFYSIGEGRKLNEMFYLVGDRAVGDAGRFLRYFLPKDYRK